jgi:hypothetical protein
VAVIGPKVILTAHGAERDDEEALVGGVEWASRTPMHTVTAD